MARDGGELWSPPSRAAGRYVGGRAVRTELKRPTGMSSLTFMRWALGLCVLLGGCVRVGTSFTPEKAEYRSGASAQVPWAYLAYRGDLQALLEAGGEVIGQMEGSGNGFAGHGDVEDRVRWDAAAWGATHVVFISAHNEKDVTPIQYLTQCATQGIGSGAVSNCTTTTSGGYTFYRPRAGYTLVRVPRERFGDLPVALGGRAAAPIAAPQESWAPSTPTAPLPPRPIPVVEPARDHDARERCRAQARDRFGIALAAESAAESEPVAQPGTDAATGWGARYARVKTSAAPPPPPPSAGDLHRQDAVSWYRGCVARGGRQLAEAPAPQAIPSSP